MDAQADETEMTLSIDDEVAGVIDMADDDESIGAHGPAADQRTTVGGEEAAPGADGGPHKVTGAWPSGSTAVPGPVPLRSVDS